MLQSRVTQPVATSAIRLFGRPLESEGLRGGIWFHVRPSSTRPAFFLFLPPHCLKKNGTLAHGTGLAGRYPCGIHRPRVGARLAAHDDPVDAS